MTQLYVEFEQLPNKITEPDYDFDWESYNSKSEEKYEGNYDFVDSNADEEQTNCTVELDVEHVANALVSKHHSKIHLSCALWNTLEFLEYANADLPVVISGKFVIRIKFNFREVVIKTVKDYTIYRGVNYYRNFANILVYYNSEIIENTHKNVSFMCENLFLFVISGIMTFVKLQYGLCQSIESNILKRVSDILYRNSIIVLRYNPIELYVKFEHIAADGFQFDSDMENDRAKV
ncbi:hypothetical protein Ahy_B03g063538 isoform A [Arachis hypogaea]|uniref:Uncharacterized protein n=1 Tax=Arachis hypogaea TaxID=3818 RepID=A0A444ZXG6_ARAHY|nr:hypothetical protein Ahy_B03g063538 isoform A [Arachis hypogaea]